MTYEDLINSIKEIASNNDIYKEGLTLTYELDEKNHMKMDEHLFYTSEEKRTCNKCSHVMEIDERFI